MALFSANVKGMTFEQYIVDHESDSMRLYLIGYADAIHNNAYLFGGCPRKFPYRPYAEYFQQIDIQIAKYTKGKQSQYSDAFFQKPIEPFLTEVILKYIDCNNPEALPLNREPQNTQIAMRELARDILKKTEKYQSPEEREMKFQYQEFLKRVNNPKKYEKKCPVCVKQKSCNVAEKPKNDVALPSPVAPVPTLYTPPAENNTSVQNNIPVQTEQAVLPQEQPKNLVQKDENIPKKEDFASIPDIKINSNANIKPKKDIVKESQVQKDLQSKKYELDSLQVNLNNINDVTLPQEQ